MRLNSLFALSAAVAALSLSSSSLPSLNDVSRFVDACYCAIGAQGNGHSTQTSAEQTWFSPAQSSVYGTVSLNTFLNGHGTAVSSTGLIWDTTNNATANPNGNVFITDTNNNNNVAISSLVGSGTAANIPPLIQNYITSAAINVQNTGKTWYSTAVLSGCVISNTKDNKFITSIQFQPWIYQQVGNVVPANHEDDFLFYVQPSSQSGEGAYTVPVLSNGQSEGFDTFFTEQFVLTQGINTIWLAVGSTDSGNIGGCPFLYKWTVSCSGGSGARGDPQFSGFLGQDYQIHGQSGTVYNILSTPTLQNNALFTYLESGECRPGTLCFSHPGNYFGAIGMRIRDPETNTVANLLLQAGGVKEGMKAFLNDIELTPSEHRLTIGAYTLHFPSVFELYMDSDELNLRLSNSDHFINQDVSIGSGLLAQIAQHKQIKRVNATAAEELEQDLPHGLLGQTWQSKTHNNRWKHIAGHLYDYAVNDGVLGSDFKYNRFQQ